MRNSRSSAAKTVYDLEHVQRCMDEYYNHKVVRNDAKNLPDVVQGMLALAEIEAEFHPERWNRGARKRAFWRLRKVTWNEGKNRAFCTEEIIKHGAGVEEWRFVITSILDKAQHEKQIRSANSHA